MIAEVLLPLPLKSTFTYTVPRDMESGIVRGSRVVVPFGNKKFYTGIVASTSILEPKVDFEIKPIAALLDAAPIVRRPQLELWQWVADYYMCGIGDVYNAAVPASLKVESTTFVELSPDFLDIASEEGALTLPEVGLCQILDHEAKHLAIDDLRKKSGLKGIGKHINSLLLKGAVIISERLVERYRSKKVVYVSPTFTPGSDEMRAAFDQVKNAPKQERALMALIELTRQEPHEVKRQELMERADVGAAIITAMAKKGVLELYKRQMSRFTFESRPSGILPTLTPAQVTSLQAIDDSWKDHAVTLLHGVTSSGKTEIYLHLIGECLEAGRQALLLVPEIALTTQLTRRVQEVFGDKVLVYHSKFSDNERVELWRRMLSTEGDTEGSIVIGSRSAVFLPFRDLGLVIVDEEHDSSYKQQDPAPRYNGRDVAIVLAGMHGAKTLLGSATPAVDTYHKASTGRFGLVTLTERYGNRPLPAIEIIDMKGMAKGSPETALAPASMGRLRSAVEGGHQGIVFLNRRGYSPMARCRMCGYIPRCRNCDVTLTYHRGASRLECHYCATTYPLPTVCPACGEAGLEIVGHGTERVEEEVTLAFGEEAVLRMDLDTTRRRDSYDNIIDDFSEGKAKILVGTQMVTKGLDFANVGAVAVVGTDSVLHYPDFRSAEHAFNMIEQVAGRAGRGDTDAVVTIQTLDTANPLFSFIKSHDYAGFFKREIEQRKTFLYPPFARIIYIYVKHKDDDTAQQIAEVLYKRLRTLFGGRVVGPDRPSVARVRMLYIRRMMLKLEDGVSLSKAKQILVDTRDQLLANYPAARSARVYFDVDPV